MAKQVEIKVVLEREYVIPLRKEWHKVPVYKRAKKATKAVKEFLMRHMKVYDTDLRKVKIGKWLNEQIWSRGIKSPPSKIHVKAIKYENGEVKVELAKLSEHAKKLEELHKAKLEVKKKKEEEKKEAEKKEEQKAEMPKTPHQEMVKKPEEKVEEEKTKTEEKAEILKPIELKEEKPMQAPKKEIHRRIAAK
ncbi:50S ribosomal protein L31e [Candidatus Pacearchaeota archaeon]|nr:50S ribosomal protein L31e [Candidatus Pacearchaeota archaeon]